MYAMYTLKLVEHFRNSIGYWVATFSPGLLILSLRCSRMN